MKAIRGATTVTRDCEEEIRAGVKELLSEIAKRNGLTDEKIIFLLFSNTSDIHSFYPAKAAREAGFISCALFSAIEPEIDGSLKKCIRVMALAETENKPCHVYLKGAEILRRDLAKIYNIALDGPAGSGKSTVSRLIAKKLDILCLDTGATYRACALKCVRENIDCRDEKSASKAINNAKIEVKYENGTQHTYLDGEDVSALIRTPQISMNASLVSSYKAVREKMVALQREIAKNTSCILDGRDIGSNVLPDAEFKFYLTAKDEVRAERRRKELCEKGVAEPFEKILEEIKLRDKQDKTRSFAPLVQAKDAILIDNSILNIEQTVDLILNKIQEKI